MILTEEPIEPGTEDLMPEADYQCLPFKTSVDFLTFFDPNARNQTYILYKWQVEVNEDISLGITRNYETGEIISQKVPDQMHPYKFALCAANGSGKDAFVITPLALWFICCKIKAKVIITSASGNQLTTQTEHYISALAREINQWSLRPDTFGREILKVNKRHIVCLLSGSVLHLFATDEAEKAEGHHPMAPGCEMLIIVNEAKSVPQEIFDALRRCTGYNVWVDVSSPGEPKGQFYTHFTKWPNRRRVSFFDCPKQSPAEFEEDRQELGEHSPLFRSKWLALFTPFGGNYIIDHTKLSELREKIKEKKVPSLLQSLPIRVGLDIALSSNGDETVLSFWRGNKQLGQKTFRIQNATELATEIEKELLKYVDREHKYIFADDGGVGRAVIDILNSNKGFKINRVLNNSASKNKKLYKNRGAQLWYKFARMIEEGLLIFKDLSDERFFNQLQYREYKVTANGLDKTALQSKREMMAAGLPSPDRADAAVLAFTDIDLSDFLGAIKKAEEAVEDTRSQNEIIAELKYNFRHNKHLIYGQKKVGRVKYSLDVLLKQTST